MLQSIAFIALTLIIFFATLSTVDAQQPTDNPLDVKQFRKLLTKGTWFRTIGPQDWQQEIFAYSFRKNGSFGSAHLSDVRVFREGIFTIKSTKKPNQFVFQINNDPRKELGNSMLLRTGTLMKYDAKSKRIYLIEKTLVKGLFLQNVPGSVFDKGWTPPKTKIVDK